MTMKQIVVQGHEIDCAHEFALHAPDDKAVLEQLKGPLTALFVYIDEVHKLSTGVGRTRDLEYLRRLAVNARTQAERALALITPTTGYVPLVPSQRKKIAHHHSVLMTPGNGPKLTKREREALILIVEGCSNKEGAVRMKIGRRTFESHRAEVMRKFNARNAADLIRKQKESSES